nr:hypothetical protein [uncultured Moraxella sp.]
MATYVCQEVVNNVCQTWVENQNLLDLLAITPAQAGKITAAICSLLALGFVLGEIAGIVKKTGR